jgi:hypothetical protein
LFWSVDKLIIAAVDIDNAAPFKEGPSSFFAGRRTHEHG